MRSGTGDDESPPAGDDGGRSAPARSMVAAFAAAGVVGGALLSGACHGGSDGAATSASDGAPPGPVVRISRIQGRSHVSPMQGEEVVADGVVTAVLPEVGFHLQDPVGDGAPETSEALVVALAGDAGISRPAVGERVRVTGTVREYVPGGTETANLSITRLEAREIRVISRDHRLPEPVLLGTGGRIPPAVRVIDRDELPVDLGDPGEVAATDFEPASEGIDFYESLEGMRVTVRRPVTVSPTERFDGGQAELFTLPDGGAHVVPEGARTARGGILLQPHPENRGDQNPERVQIQLEPGVTPGSVPELAVGSRLRSVTGVLSYAFGNFEVVATEAVETDPTATGAAAYSPSSEPGTARTTLHGSEDHVTVAAYNVLNLNPLPETADRMDRLAAQIVDRLGSPDVLALQEIQDENGTRGGPGNTVTDATATMEALVDAVLAAGGPRYAFFDVAPEPNARGGVPGGNIRNAFLYDPRRVELLGYESLTPSVLEDAGADRPTAFSGARPLAATFSLGGGASAGGGPSSGRRASSDAGQFTVINCHFTTRFGSTPIFGAVQPFVQAGEEEREAQSRALHAYVSARLSSDPRAPIAVVGDLNTMEFTDDLTRLLPGEGPGGVILENLLLRVPVDERYTYNYEGNSQALDHVFVTESLARGAEIEVVHVNVDLPESAGRASDHEPVVARLHVPPAGDGGSR